MSTASTARYHVNPQGQVGRCRAASEDSCPFGGDAHFTGTASQAKFMQDMLTSTQSGGSTQPATRPATKAKPRTAVPITAVSAFEVSREGDKFKAYPTFRGTHDITFDDGTPIANNVALMPGDLRKSILNYMDTAAPISTFQVPYDTTLDPDVREVRRVLVKDGPNTISHGYIAKKHAGWIALHNLDELRSRPYARKRGIGPIAAAYRLEAEYESRRRVNDPSYERVSAYDEIDGGHLVADPSQRLDAATAAHLDPDASAVYRVDQSAADKIRTACHVVTEFPNAPSKSDDVYIALHGQVAVPDSITIFWGSMKRTITKRQDAPRPVPGESAFTALQQWIRKETLVAP